MDLAAGRRTPVLLFFRMLSEYFETEMKITEIKPQKRLSHRVSIFLDGKYGFSLDQATLSRAGLHVGDEVSREEVDRLSQRDQFARARDYGYLLLSYRDRSEQEMRARLEKKSFSGPVIDEVLEFFGRHNLVDDGQFARKFVADSLRVRPMGRIRILHELRKKLVPAAAAEAAVAEAFGGEGGPALEKELELARAAAEKRMKHLTCCPAETARQRLYRHLHSRGFHFSVIHDVIEEYISDQFE